MPRFMLVTEHTDKDCLQALDDMVAQNAKLLDLTWFGCKSGDHTGFAIVDAGSENEAREQLPKSLRAKTKVVKVDKFTPAEVQAYHKGGEGARTR